MAVQRHRRSNLVRAKSDRQMVWLAAGLSQTAVAGSADTLVASLNAAALALRPFTIVRTRILLNYGSDQIAASEATAGAFGMIVVSDQAAGVGVTAVPHPVGNEDAPWFVYEGLLAPFLFLTSAGFEGDFGLTTKIDSKSMRKVGNNEDVVFVYSARGTFGAVLSLEGRMLIKLH